MRKLAFVLVTALALLSCSHPAPPVGRWEGTYESDDVMVAARLEIGSDGQVRVSAPSVRVGASTLLGGLWAVGLDIRGDCFRLRRGRLCLRRGCLRPPDLL